MTNPTGGEWKQFSDIISSEQGAICKLVDKRTWNRPKADSQNWDEAIANGQLIVEAVKTYRLLLEKYGPDGLERLKRLEEASRAL